MGIPKLGFTVSAYSSDSFLHLLTNGFSKVYDLDSHQVASRINPGTRHLLLLDPLSERSEPFSKSQQPNPGSLPNTFGIHRLGSLASC